uniref:Uncharacterized protein n=1 Tax=Arundo donax TaxID=35708 RepID=A0A0A9GBV1_ARUDO
MRIISNSDLTSCQMLCIIYLQFMALNIARTQDGKSPHTQNEAIHET